jgi:hypothetical protein
MRQNVSPGRKGRERQIYAFGLHPAVNEWLGAIIAAASQRQLNAHGEHETFDMTDNSEAIISEPRPQIESRGNRFGL